MSLVCSFMGYSFVLISETCKNGCEKKLSHVVNCRIAETVLKVGPENYFCCLSTLSI